MEEEEEATVLTHEAKLIPKAQKQRLMSQQCPLQVTGLNRQHMQELLELQEPRKEEAADDSYVQNVDDEHAECCNDMDAITMLKTQVASIRAVQSARGPGHNLPLWGGSNVAIPQRYLQRLFQISATTGNGKELKAAKRSPRPQTRGSTKGPGLEIVGNMAVANPRHVSGKDCYQDTVPQRTRARVKCHSEHREVQTTNALVSNQPSIRQMRTLQSKSFVLDIGELPYPPVGQSVAKEKDTQKPKSKLKKKKNNNKPNANTAASTESNDTLMGQNKRDGKEVRSNRPSTVDGGVRSTKMSPWVMDTMPSAQQPKELLQLPHSASSQQVLMESAVPQPRRVRPISAASSELASRFHHKTKHIDPVMNRKEYSRYLRQFEKAANQYVDWTANPSHARYEDQQENLEQPGHQRDQQAPKDTKARKRVRLKKNSATVLLAGTAETQQ